MGEKELTAEDFDSLDDAEVVEVQVPEWKASVHIRVLSADEALRLAEAAKNPEANAYKLLAACVCGKSGQPIFATEKEAKEKLGKRSIKAVGRIVKAINKLQGLDDRASAKNALGEEADASSPTG